MAMESLCQLHASFLCAMEVRHGHLNETCIDGTITNPATGMLFTSLEYILFLNGIQEVVSSILSSSTSKDKHLRLYDVSAFSLSGPSGPVLCHYFYGVNVNLRVVVGTIKVAMTHLRAPPLCKQPFGLSARAHITGKSGANPFPRRATQ